MAQEILNVNNVYNIFTNKNWLNIYRNCLFDNTMLYSNDYEEEPQNQNYKECIGTEYVLSPMLDHIASQNISVFDPKKAAAMYFWYKFADRSCKSIIEYFPEYARCIDENHDRFNSNYGYYANDGLNICIDALKDKKDSRQACFMINNNEAMGKNSIDKLCTNAVMFFIRNNRLDMIVQMRSSNLLTLLPYDAFIFSFWYAKVYNKLVKVYSTLRTGHMKIQVASLHFYVSDFNKKAAITERHDIINLFDYHDLHDDNFENKLESKLINFLK